MWFGKGLPASPPHTEPTAEESSGGRQETRAIWGHEHSVFHIETEDSLKGQFWLLPRIQPNSGRVSFPCNHWVWAYEEHWISKTNKPTNFLSHLSVLRVDFHLHVPYGRAGCDMGQRKGILKAVAQIKAETRMFRVCWELSYAELLSRVWLFMTPWTVAPHAPLSMGFPREEYRSGLPFPPPGDLPNPGIEPKSFVSPALPQGQPYIWRAVCNPTGLECWVYMRW